MSYIFVMCVAALAALTEAIHHGHDGHRYHLGMLHAHKHSASDWLLFILCLAGAAAVSAYGYWKFYVAQGKNELNVVVQAGRNIPSDLNPNKTFVSLQLGPKGAARNTDSAFPSVDEHGS